MLKLWVDDLRPAPHEYQWIKTVDTAVEIIRMRNDEIDEINLDHDAGIFNLLGGDYINILNEMEKLQFLDSYTFDFMIKFHTKNPVGLKRMKQICERNGWNYE